MEVVIFVDFTVSFCYVCLVVSIGDLCCLFFPVRLFWFNCLFTSETPMFMHLHMPGCETKKEFISCTGQFFVVSRALPGVCGSQHSSRV